jgi:Cyclopropane fatty acid synthase and related methyltransferases
MSDIEKSVEVVGAAWRQSPYYDDAERWTILFWNDGTPFRKFFDQLDLAPCWSSPAGMAGIRPRSRHNAAALILMDIFQENIDFSRHRLRFFNNVDSHVNNGYDFQPIADGSLSSIFCYDAMVHFAPEVVRSYLKDTARVLKPGGRALFHHSNYPTAPKEHYGQNPHSRNQMTEATFRDYTREAGLETLGTQIISWGQIPDLDCISLVAKPAAA